MSYNWNVGSGLGFILSLDGSSKSKLLITAGHTLGGQPVVGATVSVSADGRLVDATLLDIKDTGSGPDIAVLCMPDPEPAYALGSIAGNLPTDVVFARRSQSGLIQGRAAVLRFVNANKVAVAEPNPDQPLTGDSGAVVVSTNETGAATSNAVAVVTDRLQGWAQAPNYAFTLLQPQRAWLEAAAQKCP